MARAASVGSRHTNDQQIRLVSSNGIRSQTIESQDKGKLGESWSSLGSEWSWTGEVDAPSFTYTAVHTADVTRFRV
jgi:hypothetical protein